MTVPKKLVRFVYKQRLLNGQAFWEQSVRNLCWNWNLDGEFFCLETGQCSSSCQPDDKEAGEEYNGIENSCQNGLTFCLRREICAEDCDAVDDDEDEEDDQTFQDCPEGTTFCLSTRLCSKECSKEEETQDSSDGNFISIFFG